MNRFGDVMIDHDELMNAISYDPDNGVIYKRSFKIVDGEIVHEYLNELKPKYHCKVDQTVITFDKKRYDAGRLIWYYQTGKFPKYGNVKFKNGNMEDIRWSNLELVIGESFFNEEDNKWSAYVILNDERIHLGLHYTKESADNALNEAIAKIRLYAK